MAGLQSLPAPSTFECSEGWAADTTALEIQEEESLSVTLKDIHGETGNTGGT